MSNTQPSQLNQDMFRPSSASQVGARVPKACLPCAKVKARCEVDAGCSACQRCRRLKKTCRGQAPGAHRRTQRTPDIANGADAFLAASRLASNGPGTDPYASPADLTPSTCIAQVFSDDSETEIILQTFKDVFQPLFPFVVLQEGVSSQDLRRNKPFLFLVILMVASRHDEVRQAFIAKKLRDIISYTLLVKGERSLEILQGLLIYVNWYHLHLQLGSQL